MNRKLIFFHHYYIGGLLISTLLGFLMYLSGLHGRTLFTLLLPILNYHFGLFFIRYVDGKNLFYYKCK